VQDTIQEADTVLLASPGGNESQLGLLGEDLELKGEAVGRNLAAVFTEALYTDHGLRAPATRSSTLRVFVKHSVVCLINAKAPSDACYVRVTVSLPCEHYIIMRNRSFKPMKIILSGKSR
jgi:hypothetical protein